MVEPSTRLQPQPPSASPSATSAVPAVPAAAGDPPAPTRAQRLLASLNAGSLGVAIGFAVTAAVTFSPIFVVPFPVLLGRSLFVSMVLLLAFVGAQRVAEDSLPHWLPRWLFVLIAVGVAAPVATFLVYLFSVGGRVGEFVNSEPRVTGFVIIASTALLLGMLLTLTAQLRQREAQARALALELELERSRVEKCAVDTRLAALQAQIEPHFLFNTLANVQALVETGSPRAAPVLASLVAYLRATLPRLHEGAPTLGAELALVRAYLELMQLRMPDRLQWSVRAEPGVEALAFPPMALLTLVENAVRHGIDPGEEGGRIDVVAACEPGRCRVAVVDTGVGLRDGAPEGTGLTNLRSRLAAGWGPAAALTIQAQAPRGVRAEIAWPTP